MKNTKMHKIISTLIILFVLMWTLSAFYYINGKNYNKRIEAKMTYVNHPELLPETDYVKYTTFGFKNLKADLYWLEAIQYIWWNAISSDYKKYLFKMLDNITELNPEFEKPYYIGLLLLPSYNERYEKLSKEEIRENIIQWETLWLKWVEAYCDKDKMDLILNQDDLSKIASDAKYRNPCKSYTIPFYLAYLYYYYKFEPETAAKYYKIASANDDAPGWATTMAAIMQGKGWNREKSFFMFLNIAKYTEPDNQVCTAYANQLELLGAEIYLKKSIPLDQNVIKQVELTRNVNLWMFDEKMEEEILSDTKCMNYVNKSIRELNLSYIESAEEKYFKDTQSHSSNASELYKKWYLKFLPTDFQQYEDHWIIYEFNKDTQNYDYIMWNYDEY